MSSRVLRKLHGDKEHLNEETSDIEPDLTSSGGARKKQLNVNRYDLLNQQSHSESEVKEDDNETEANKSCGGDNNNHESVKRKKRKKKKKSGKSVNNQRSSEDNADFDEVERSVREVNRLLGDVDPRQVIVDEHYFPRSDKVHHHKTVLSVYSRNLNPNNELKRIFGSKIIQSEQHKKKNRGGQGGGGPNAGPGARPSYHHLRHNMSLVAVKDTWPQMATGSATGLTMSVQEFKNGVQYFAYEHSPTYRQVQRRFLLAVESLNPDHMLAIIRDHPYHVDALLQLSDLCRLNEDLAMAAELVERALYCLECAFHPLFTVSAVSGGGGEIGQGGCRLDYRRQENRAVFITLFKHLLNVGGRACYRTALELCKLLLGLDPDVDPLAAKLAVDFYALRAKEYHWLVQLCEEFESNKNLSQLPNFAYGLPVAHYRLQEAAKSSSTSGSKEATVPSTDAPSKDDGSDVASQLLQRALITFPGILQPLLDKCGVQTDKRVVAHTFFGARMQDKQPESLKTLINLYVQRSYHVWKDPELLPWLEANVNRVLDRVDADDPLVAEMAAHRGRWYRGPLPRSICRHIVLSDIKGVTVTPTTEDFANGVLAFDPFPPVDTINIYNRPARPTVNSSNASALGIFFRSLIPTFNMIEAGDDRGAVVAGENAIQQVDALNLMQPAGDVAGAAAPEGVAGAGNELRRSVASLVDAMHYLLNNMRPGNAPTNNDEADVDENDESSDTDVDADHNNYLT